MGCKNFLDIETKRNIYDYILKNPGVHLREISRNLNLNIYNLDYHIKILLKHNLIYQKENDGYHRYFIAKKIGNKEKELLCFLREKILRDIVVIIMWRYALSLKDLSKAFEKPPSSITFHLEKLKKAGIIEPVEKGKGLIYRHDRSRSLERNTNSRISYYRLKEPFFVYETILMYEESILSKETKEIMDSLEIIKHNKHKHVKEMDHIIDDIFIQIFEIFPNPYHV